MSIPVVKQLERLGEAAESPELRDNIGRGLVRLLKDHLDKLQATRPNKMGFPRQNWYAKASDSVNHRLIPGGVRASVSQDGFKKRVEGGEIRPVTKKALTQPIHPEAYGKGATDPSWGELFFIPLNKGNVVGALARRVAGKGAGEFLYLLLKKVVIKPDPSLVPKESEINQVVAEEIDHFLGATGGAA